MKKNAYGLFFISFLTLAGCQTTSGVTNIADTDFSNMSCDEIKQVFDTYTERMSQMETGGSLLSSVGFNSGTSEGLTVMRTAYNNARNIANPIMTTKQCAFKV